MPCRDYGSEDRAIPLDSVYQKELDKLTALLCKACEALNIGEVLTDNKELQEWYEEHRQNDLANMRNLLDEMTNEITRISKNQFDKLDDLLNEILES